MNHTHVIWEGFASQTPSRWDETTSTFLFLIPAHILTTDTHCVLLLPGREKMRTPAEDYFGEKAFSELFEELIKFGQETLGCTTISPPWLSFYVDGCEQRFHTDSWHGPWAFVLSLTGAHL